MSVLTNSEALRWCKRHQAVIQFYNWRQYHPTCKDIPDGTICRIKIKNKTAYGRTLLKCIKSYLEQGGDG